MRLSLLVLRCMDIGKSREFYETLGFEFSQEKHGKVPTHYSSESYGFVLDLYPRKTGKEIDLSFIAFVVEDPIDKERLCFKLGETKDSGESLHLFGDPDGRKIEIRIK